MVVLYKKLKRNGRCIDEHRYLWEQAYGPIPNGFEIHHKNEDKRDNRLENLELKPIPLHRREHALKGRKCSVPGCNLPHWGRGYCKKHWYRWRRTGDVNGLRGPSNTNPSCIP